MRESATSSQSSILTSYNVDNGVVTSSQLDSTNLLPNPTVSGFHNLSFSSSFLCLRSISKLYVQHAIANKIFLFFAALEVHHVTTTERHVSI